MLALAIAVSLSELLDPGPAPKPAGVTPGVALVAVAGSPDAEAHEDVPSSLTPSLQTLVGIDAGARVMRRGRLHRMGRATECREFELSPLGVRIRGARGASPGFVPWSEVDSLEVRAPGLAFYAGEDMSMLLSLVGIVAALAVGASAGGDESHRSRVFGTTYACFGALGITVGMLGDLGVIRTQPWHTIHRRGEAGATP